MIGADWTPAFVLLSFGAIAYCCLWHVGLPSPAPSPRDLVAARFALRSQIIWRKQRTALSRGDYHWAHEPC